MRLAILFSMLLMACASAPEEQSTPETTVEEHIPLPSGGGFYNPCGRVYVVEFTTDSGTYRKEIPIYCNPNPDEHYWDPVDPQKPINPDIWTNPEQLPEVNPQQPRP